MSPKTRNILIGLVLVSAPLTAYTCMVTMAYRHNAGPIETQAFERSRLFDQEKAERKRFETLGLNLKCETSTQQCRVSIAGTEQPVKDGLLSFKRPSDAQSDFKLQWASNQQDVLAALPLPGLWYLEFSGQVNGESVRARQNIYIP